MVVFYESQEVSRPDRYKNPQSTAAGEDFKKMLLSVKGSFQYWLMSYTVYIFMCCWQYCSLSRTLVHQIIKLKAEAVTRLSHSTQTGCFLLSSERGRLLGESSTRKGQHASSSYAPGQMLRVLFRPYPTGQRYHLHVNITRNSQLQMNTKKN